MKPKIKICGITNLIDAKNSINLGADFIGFINIEYSPRFLRITDIEQISKDLNEEERSKIVLLTQDDSIDSLVSACSTLGVKAIQPYANFSPTDLNKLRSIGFKVFKPIGVANTDDIDKIDSYKNAADVIVLDTKTNDPELLGGSGKAFDWNLFVKAKKAYDVELALAGGLNPENVAEAIELTQPYMIDLASGVESKPGIKSFSKLKALFEACNIPYTV